MSRRSPPRPTPSRPHPPAARDGGDVPLTHPAWWLAIAVAAACVVVSVSYVLYDKDMWQHLAVGRHIWETRAVPTTQLWTWPTYGQPDVNSSWGFRVLVWPVWNAFGVNGLFAWRWITTLVAFGLLWAAARRMGARGFTALVVAVVASLTYRQRSQIRPETLVAVLLALEVWILETRRAGGPDRSRWLVPVVWAWANAHISWFMGPVLIGVHLLDDLVASRRGTVVARRDSRRLGVVALAAVAIAFVNPFGWRALWQPFDFFLHGRNEPIFQSIFELMPLNLGINLTNGLPLVLGGWLVLLVRRALRAGVDVVEVALYTGFVGLSFATQRFLGFTILVALPFLARDLDDWIRARRWPAWTSPAWARAGFASAACVLAGLVEWRGSDLPLGVSVDPRQVPAAAADWMERHGVDGRGFNPFYLGGYVVYRFHAAPDRLPFMDIHQAGTPRDRYSYAFIGADARAWRDLDARHRFEWALLRRVPYPGDRMLDVVEADSAFALVFMDDAGALYLRRHGRFASLAESLGYRVNPAGPQRLAMLGQAVLPDSALRARSVAELVRESRESPYHALAEVRLASVALVTGDTASAARHARAALASDPRVPRAHERLGLVALAAGRPREALAEFAAENRLPGGMKAYDLRVGQAWQAMGDPSRARRHYRRELKRDPANEEARAALAGTERHR